MILLIIEWIAAILGMSGGILIVKKQWYGYVIWLVSNSMWVALGIMLGMYGSALQFIMFNIICAYGVYEWKVKK